MVQGVITLIVLLGIAYAAGYFTRDFQSRKRRAAARRTGGYTQPDWLNPTVAANTNETPSPPSANSARCWIVGKAGPARVARGSFLETTSATVILVTARSKIFRFTEIRIFRICCRP